MSSKQEYEYFVKEAHYILKSRLPSEKHLCIGSSLTSKKILVDFTKEVFKRDTQCFKI